MYNKENLKKKIIHFLEIILIISIMFISLILINLVSTTSKKKNNIKIIEDIQENITESVKENNVDSDNTLELLKELYDINQDLVGYLIIPDTNINYPVMYTQSDYYLRKDFYKSYSLGGTLYIDKHNTLEPRDTNLIIYGHNMTKEGTMFHDLEKYKSEEFYKNHKKITYYTLKEKQEYEIVAVFLSEVYRVTDNVFKYYKFYNAENKDEMKEYYDNIKKISLYDTGLNLEFGDELLTLSTCDYSKENGRLVVVARKVKVEFN